MNKPEVQSGRLSTAPIRKKISREEMQKQIAKMRDRDAEMVTGIFKNLEAPAQNGSLGMLQFGFKKYPGDEFAFYEFHDGERYTIPRAVAHHLNNNCYHKEYAHLPGEYGQQGIRTGFPDESGRLQKNAPQMAKKIYRFNFSSLEYMDDDLDMYPADLVEVNLNPII